MENGTGTCQPHNRPSNQTLKLDPQTRPSKTQSKNRSAPQVSPSKTLANPQKV